MRALTLAFPLLLLLSVLLAWQPWATDSERQTGISPDAAEQTASAPRTDLQSGAGQTRSLAKTATGNPEGLGIAEAQGLPKESQAESGPTGPWMEIRGTLFQEISKDVEIPAAGVEVLVQRRGHQPHVKSSTKTSGDGSFVLRLRDPHIGDRNYLLEVPGDSQYAVLNHLEECKKHKRKVRGLRLVQRPLNTLNGIVVDPFDRPLEGASVVYTRTQKEGSAQTDMYIPYVTGPDGLFQIPKVGSGQLAADLKGMMQVSGFHPIFSADGHRIVMAPTSQLTVQAQIDPEHPLFDTPIGFRSARQKGQPMAWKISARTDKSGTVGPLLAPAQVPLEITINRLDLTFSRMDKTGRLIAEGPIGEPIFLQPGEHKALRISWEDPGTVTGIVLDPEGRPILGTNVMLSFPDPKTNGQQPPNRRGQFYANTDGDGRFELTAYPEHPTQEAVLFVRHMANYGNDRKGPNPPYTATGELRIPWPPAGGDVTLQAQRTFPIQGKCIDAEGNPRPGELSLHPTDESLNPSPRLPKRSRWDRTNKSARFAFRDLPAGTYDIRYRAFGAHEPIWVYGVQAGTTDLVIQLGHSEPSTVTVQIHGATEFGAETQVRLITARLLPGSAKLPSLPVLAADSSHSSPTGWPREIQGHLAKNRWEYRGDLGRATFHAKPVSADPQALELAPGPYWFAAIAQTKDRYLTAPMGTGLVRLRSGAHRLHLHLQPAGEVQGKIEGLPPGNRYRLSATTPQGKPLTFSLPNGLLVQDQLLPGHGAFHLLALPEGPATLSLWSGAPSNNRKPLRTKTVQVRPGETTEVPWSY